MATTAPFAAFPRSPGFLGAATAPTLQQPNALAGLDRLVEDSVSSQPHAQSPRTHLHQPVQPAPPSVASASSSANCTPRRFPHSATEWAMRSDDRYLPKASSMGKLALDGPYGWPTGAAMTSAGASASTAPLDIWQSMGAGGDGERSALRSAGLGSTGAVSHLDRLEAEVTSIIDALRQELDVSGGPQAIQIPTLAKGPARTRSSGATSRCDVGGEDSPIKVLTRESSGRYMMPTAASELRLAASSSGRAQAQARGLQQTTRQRSAPRGSRSKAVIQPPSPAVVACFEATSADEEVRLQNLRLQSELREAQMALEAYTCATARRERTSQEMEATVASLQAELRVATERTAALEQRVASTHVPSALQPPASCEDGAAADGVGTSGQQSLPATSAFEAEAPAEAESALDPSEVPPPPADPEATLAREESLPIVAAPCGPATETLRGDNAPDVAQASSTSPVTDRSSEKPLPPADASEELWEFVVQGRSCAPGEVEAVQKGVTCFPAAALERVQATGAAFVCLRGRRLDVSAPNQDDLLLAMCRYQGDGRVALYGVFDGHGPSGHQCAAFTRGFLPERIFGDPALLSKPEEVLKAAFREAHDGLLLREGRALAHEGKASGTTASVALVLEIPGALGDDSGQQGGEQCQASGTWVFVAHIGDSRVVLGSRSAPSLEAPGARQDIEAIVLTREHRPDDVEEAQGIRDRGGEVRKMSSKSAARVFIPGRSQPGLALTRVLGDTADAHGGFGISAEPDVVSHLVRPGQDLMLLLGTDGFFEFCPPCEAFAQMLQKGISIATLEALCNESRRRWASNSYNQTCDDATAIAVSLSLHRDDELPA
eukprot:CAMPEP_0176080188 /NCGR_PEP_ID=MMETSP0120_2-20121206/40108_1 /TAXON_ID=160619 /ORGANISM="Kryptoperidinium foliaceum, Strain CCMP 1326" /LENGTH=834 /DNA_ID=CAMNT_0017413949 /DNA_START=18 /DNA_END=2519 /DNA_ORIENTATION=+